MRYLPFLLAFCCLQALAAPVRVAVIDTGLDLQDPRFKSHLCPFGHSDFTGTGIADVTGHGTHIAGLIVDNAGSADYCLIILKFFSEEASAASTLRSEISAIFEAARLGATIIIMSFGGTAASEYERTTLTAFSWITFLAAAGNLSRNLDITDQEFYPASYNLPNVMIVGSLDSEGRRARSSNWGNNVRHWERGQDVVSTVPGGGRARMSGTSQATAVATGKLIAGILKEKVSPQCDDYSCPYLPSSRHQ